MFTLYISLRGHETLLGPQAKLVIQGFFFPCMTLIAKGISLQFPAIFHAFASIQDYSFQSFLHALTTVNDLKACACTLLVPTSRICFQI